MNSRKKCAWLLVATGALVALIVAAGKIYSATQDPLSAFEREKAGTTGDYFADKTGSTTKKTANLSSAMLSPPDDPDSGGLAAATPSADAQDAPSAEETATAAPTPVPTANAAQELGGTKIAVTLLGIDSNEDREEKNMGSRSDVIVVCVIDVETPSCALLTIPRDTRVKIRKLDKSGNVKSTRTDKINAAYAYGGGDPANSCENALSAINGLLGTELYYYAAMDMDAIGPLVQAVGGITLTLPADIDGVGKEGETVTLNPDTAYTYVRKRKGVQGGSDLARTARQQVFFKALAQRIKELGVSSVPAVWNAMSGRVTTNLTLSQMAALAGVLSKLDTNAIGTYTVPGKGKTIDGTSFYIADGGGTEELVRTLFGQ